MARRRNRGLVTRDVLRDGRGRVVLTVEVHADGRVRLVPGPGSAHAAAREQAAWWIGYWWPAESHDERYARAWGD